MLLAQFQSHDIEKKYFLNEHIIDLPYKYVLVRTTEFTTQIESGNSKIPCDEMV